MTNATTHALPAVPTHIQNAIDKYGVAAQNVGTITLNLERLKREGVFVQARITGMSLLTQTPTWEELGIPRDDERAKAFTRGVRRNFPTEVIAGLERLEGAMRRVLAKHSMAHGVPWISYEWVPATAFSSLRYQFDRIKSGYQEKTDSSGNAAWEPGWDARVQSLIMNYDAFALDLIDGAAEAASEAYDSLVARGRVNGSPMTETREDFVQRIVTTVSERVETRKIKIKNELKAELMIAVLEDERDLEQALASLDAARLERERSRADLYTMQQIAQAKIEQARQDLATNGSPYLTVIKAVYENMATDIVSIAGTIQRLGYLPGGTAEKARGLKEIYKLLAVQSDESLEGLLNQLETALNAPAPEAPVAAPEATKGKKGGKTAKTPKSYDMGRVSLALDEILDYTAHIASEISAATPSRMSNLDLDD